MKYLVYDNIMGKWIQSINTPLWTANIEYAYDFHNKDSAETWIRGKQYLNVSVVEVGSVKTFKTRGPTK